MESLEAFREAGRHFVLLAALVLFMGCSSGRSSAEDRPVHSCATLDGAYVQLSEIPGSFESFVDMQFRHSPLTLHHVPGSSAGPAISEFTAARLRGYVATVAVSGPDRPSEDAIARALNPNQAPGKWPAVPLSGPVVMHNRGILELYVTNSEFQSVSGSEAMMSVLKHSADLLQSVQTIDQYGPRPTAQAVSISLADDSYAYETFLGTPNAMNGGAVEREVVIGVRKGRFTLQLTVQGGDAVTFAGSQSLLKISLDRLKRSCDG
jgi:hypothetical protein